MKANEWQLQEAKAKFSQVVDRCCAEGPQIVTRYGEHIAVVLSATDFELMARPQRKVDVDAKRRRLARRFKGRRLKGNPVLEDREGGR